MEKGQVPWHMPWEISQNAQGTIVAGVNRSLSSGKLYEGINSLLLSLIANQEQYKNRYWGTYLGIKKAGGQIRKGEKGVYVLKWDFIPSSKVKTIAPNARVLLSTSKVTQPCNKCESEKLKHPLSCIRLLFGILTKLISKTVSREVQTCKSLRKQEDHQGTGQGQTKQSYQRGSENLRCLYPDPQRWLY